MSTTITTAEARRHLGDQAIGDPTDDMVSAVVDMLAELSEALAEDPTLNDYAGAITEIADRAAFGLGLDEVGGSVDVLRYEHGMGECATIEDNLKAAVWEIFSGIAQCYVGDNRPSPVDVPWSDVPAVSHGAVLIGVSESEGHVYVEVEIGDNGRLSICGHYENGGGQCDHVLHKLTPAPWYSADDIKRLREVWDRWHLNDMRAYCEHQRRVADRMGKRPGEIFTTRNTHCEGETHPREVKPGPDVVVPRIVGTYGRLDGKQMSNARVRCAVCDYDYRSAWLSEEVPADVLRFLARFDDSEDKEVRRILESENPGEPSGEWSVYDVACVLTNSKAVDLTDMNAARAAIGRVCPSGGRYVGGTSGHLYSLQKGGE